jgi:FkbM family methyltransferase
MDLARDATLAAALTRLAAGGVEVESIIKIGAGNGADVPYVERYFPGAHTLLIEMDAQFEAQWEVLREKIPTLQWAICAASDHDGEGFMRKANAVGGVATLERTADAVAVEHRRIDSLVEEHRMPGPYFLRFDTHGAEIMVLAGALQTLKHTSLIQMEVYNDFKLMPFWEMIPHLRALGFRLLDMSDPLYRSDGALWQMHLFFVSEDHPAFAHRSFNVKQ